MLWHIEEPITDLSALGFQLLSRLARQTVTVALSGQAADELFGGYRKHQVAHGADVIARVPGATRTAATPHGFAQAGSRLARGFAAVSTADPADRLLAMSRVAQRSERLALFTEDSAPPWRMASTQSGHDRQHASHGRLDPRADTGARSAVGTRGPAIPVLRQDVDGGLDLRSAFRSSTTVWSASASLFPTAAASGCCAERRSSSVPREGWSTSRSSPRRREDSSQLPSRVG